ncbi:MAG: primosomal protein N' [Sorangiineae bacterium]|nr:primosomal protein N' [Polyangiaceae bacterium]MEB2321813.1 primosomal protein N' [Sorangiineae bacterium]
MRFVRVAVPVPLGQGFTYSVPEEHAARAQRGARVLVEFGRRRVLGVVMGSSEETDLPLERVKPIQAVVDDEPVIPGELVDFLVELARYYLAPIGEVVRLALPAVERAAAEALDEQGLLEGARVATVGRMVQVARAIGEAPPELRGQASAVFEHLRALGPTPLAALEERWGNARDAVRRLARAGAVVVERVSQAVDPFFEEPAARDAAPALTPAQAAALGAVVAALDAGVARAFLLHGVTASGKTEVYLGAVGRVLESGGGAIVLVPEIALTPQLVARFRARLGEGIAVLHSGLSDRDRYSMWKRLRSGELRVAVGARSALFAPVRELRLICVDEEHDGSFKQEEGVRYSGRDMALLRAHRAGAVCVLGSATPSVASEAAVRAGRLERLRLPARARAATRLPEVEVVDLRRTGPGPSGHRLISLPLHRALERTLEAHGQAILFLNRRGFAPSVVCEGCGEIAGCPSCSVALTLHRERGGRLTCHYCDYSTKLPEACPKCGSSRLALEGAGTERIEELLATSFPSARVARLDRDVAAGLKSARVLERMRRGELDILVGTQMVTKGHDLPEVTLVGVLNADAALGLPDFRAAERTFQLLVQVAGRAGRGDAPGKVIIQTWDPEHPAIRASVRHDVDGFVERELRDREELGYPPFSRMALVRVEGTDERRAEAEARRLAAVARRAATPGVLVVGPAAAPLAKLRSRYRFRFMVRSAERAPLRQTLLAVARAPFDRRIHVVIDVDPVSML